MKLNIEPLGYGVNMWNVDNRNLCMGILTQRQDSHSFTVKYWFYGDKWRTWTEHYEMNFVLILEEMVCGHLKRIARAYEYEF